MHHVLLNHQDVENGKMIQDVESIHVAAIHIPSLLIDNHAHNSSTLSSSSNSDEILNLIKKTSALSSLAHTMRPYQ